MGLVVLRTKAQNGFCLMCTKGCYTVLNRSKPFWGQFWGQICETDSHTHRSNKCAALVPLRNADTNITRFSRRKSPTNRYISFTLRQEVVRKYHATTAPHTAPVAARNAPVWAHSNRICAVHVQPNTAPNSPPLGLSYPRTAFPVQALPGRVSPVQEKPAQINKILKSIKIRIFPPESCRDAYNLTPESTAYDCAQLRSCDIIYLSTSSKDVLQDFFS